ncbi:DUF262 domain-containing protein, partial [Actinomadura sp. KC216]|uniref:DUF262 domain-containing protein n=1 Tax=Actinomadura sp. KC216 TaxID=2530370 RepID=UPI0010464780
MSSFRFPRARTSRHDTRPTTPRLGKLAERVMEGEVRLPTFQRDFVWTRRQVLDLLDSVARNYPIGSVLLWSSTLELDSSRTIAGLDIEIQRADGKVDYLLDGQQRLSTICGALYWNPEYDPDPDSYWNIVYDLNEERFLHRDDIEEPPIHQIPVRLLGSPSAYFNRSVAPEHIDARKLLFDRFTDYSVAVVTLDDMPIAEIGKIFERTNTTGTPLTIVEFMRAATWSEDFDLVEAIDRIRVVLARKHYGQIDRKVLLRAIAAASGFGFSTEDIEELRSRTPAQLDEAVEAVTAATRHAVDFLTTQIGTPTADALPYMNQFAVLTEVFRQVPKPTDVQYRAIRSWFWRAVLSSYFKGWRADQMANDLAAISAFALGRTAGIDVTASPPSAQFWRRTAYHRGSSATKAFALMLAAADPIDFRSGARIDVGKALAQSNEMEFHHFFPRAWLKTQGYRDEQANVLANIIMLTSISNKAISDQAPALYLQDEIDIRGEKEFIARLETSLIQPSALNHALANEYELFLDDRSQTIANWMSDLA